MFSYSRIPGLVLAAVSSCTLLLNRADAGEINPPAVLEWGPFRAYQVSVSPDGVDDSDLRAKSPALAADPSNPDHFVVTFSERPPLSDSFAAISETFDGGKTWVRRAFAEKGADASLRRQDGFTLITREGRIIANDLNGAYASADATCSWDVLQSRPAYWGFVAEDPHSGQHDGVVYMSLALNDDVYRSFDGGQTFSRFCESDDCPEGSVKSVYGAGFTIGARSRVYFEGDVDGWPDDYFCRSDNAWDEDAIPIATFCVPPPTKYTPELLRSCDSAPLQRRNWIAVARSDHPDEETVFYLEGRNLRFNRSPDGGRSWGAGRLLLGESTQACVRHGTLTRAPSGRLDVTFMDRDIGPDPDVTRTKYMYSMDDGETWSVPIPVTPPIADDYVENVITFSGWVDAVSRDDGVRLAFVHTLPYNVTAFRGAVFFTHIPPDCNANGVPDAEDIASGTAMDATENGLPDECEWDCNENGTPDSIDIATGASGDCLGNGIPDECEFRDINANGTFDDCEIERGDLPDCNHNGVPDALDLDRGFDTDCNQNGIPDSCELCNNERTSCARLPERECQSALEVLNCDGDFRHETFGLGSELDPPPGEIVATGLDTPEGIVRGAFGDDDGFFVATLNDGVYHYAFRLGELAHVDPSTGPTYNLLISDEYPVLGEPRLIRIGYRITHAALDAPHDAVELASPADIGNRFFYSGTIVGRRAPNDAPLLLTSTPFSTAESSLWLLNANGDAAPLTSFDSFKDFSSVAVPDDFGTAVGRVLLSPSQDGRVVSFDPTSGELEPFAELANLGDTTHGRHLAFSPRAWAASLNLSTRNDRVLAISVAGSFNATGGRGSIQLFDPMGRLVGVLSRGADGGPIDPRGLLFWEEHLYFGDINTGTIQRVTIDSFGDIDCDENRYPDGCDLAAGRLGDRDGDGVADMCDPVSVSTNFDFDGFVTIREFAELQNCMAEEDRLSNSSPCLHSSDLNFDFRISAEDYRPIFDNLWPTYPNEPSCGDGVLNFGEACDPPNGSTCLPGCLRDFDSDGIPSHLDRCRFGDDRIDSDADGVPDACDIAPTDPAGDADRDGIGDSIDPCPGDAANDEDGDGVCGSSDVCPGGDDAADFDNDGIPDACDPCPASAANDVDGDGLCEDLDPCARDRLNDADGDGICADEDPDPCTADIDP